jgi:hypothetical protein
MAPTVPLVFVNAASGFNFLQPKDLPQGEVETRAGTAQRVEVAEIMIYDFFNP